MNETSTETTPVDGGRRRLLTGLTVGGVALVGGAAGGISTAAVTAGSRGAFERTSLRLDVACVGDTWRDTPARDPADEADFRMPFSVEGLMYPEGTIGGDGFVPTLEGAMGQWLCSGWLILDGARPEPHASTVQTYLFGQITEDQLFPRDGLTSSGLEGTATDQTTTRSVTGGTGRWMAATGQVLQTVNGVNTTVLRDGSDAPAPNFVFSFDLVTPVLA